MSLLCFWRQRTLSHLTALGRPIPVGSALERHLIRCRDCRQYREDLSHLEQGLTRALTAPTPSPAFTRSVMRKLPALPCAAPAYNWKTGFALAAGTALAAVLVYAGWRCFPMPNPSMPTKIASAPPAVAPTGQGASLHAPEKKPTTRRLQMQVRMNTISRESRRHPGALAVHRLRHRRRVSGAALYAQKSQQESPQGGVLPAWAAWGSWYEEQGDYGRAAEAYGRAYAQQPDSALAYEAGMDSERAGDLTQALGYYACVLSPPAQTPPKRSTSQKGTEL